MENEGDSDTNHNRRTWKNPKESGKDIGETRNPNKNKDRLEHSTNEIG